MSGTSCLDVVTPDVELETSWLRKATAIFELETEWLGVVASTFDVETEWLKADTPISELKPYDSQRLRMSTKLKTLDPKRLHPFPN